MIVYNNNKVSRYDKYAVLRRTFFSFCNNILVSAIIVKNLQKQNEKY